MKRKIILILLSLIGIICMSIFFTACSQSEIIEYSELEMEEGIVYLTDYSVKYTSEHESPSGEVTESSLSEEKSGSVQTYYLVMDFDMQMAEDMQGMEWLTVTMKVLDADVVKATINYTNTSTTKEITADGETTITATYSLPEKAKEIKNVNLVVELKSQNVGATDIICTFESDNKPVTGYEDSDTTYVYSSDNITLKKTSFKYTLNDDSQSYSVASIGTKSNLELRSIYIPEIYNGLPVTAISDYVFENYTSLIKIVIPESIISIGNSAFYNCSSLTNITIPDSVTSIDNYAFYECSSLTSVTIPDNVTTIGDSTFYNCSSLTNITVNSGNTTYRSIDGNLYSYDGKTLIQYAIGKTDTSFTIPDNVTEIGNSAFSYCASLTDVTIGSSVTSIGNHAFYNCSSLTNIKIPNSITSIGNYAFSGCTSLTYNNYESGKYLGNDNNKYLVLMSIKDTSISTFIINSDTKIIYYRVFYNCSSLTEIIIPDSVTEIGADAFKNCTSLTDVTIGGSVITIGTEAFYNCTALTEIYFKATSMNDLLFFCAVFNDGGQSGEGITLTIGANVTKIPACLFCPSNSITAPKIISVVFEENSKCTSIGNHAFYCCTSLTSITLPDSVTEIGSFAFYKCSSLSDVIIGNSVETISESAFEICTSLVSIIIPDSVTSIGNYAFCDCASLTSVTIGSGVTSIGIVAFAGCSKLASVIFANTSGWYATDNEGDTSGTTISDADLSNGYTAAEYLRSTYCSYYWYRSES